MATRTVIALYDDFNTARDVVQELTDAGFSRDRISLIANDTSGEYSRYLGEMRPATTIEEPQSGASAGAGIGALTIPGIGPVLAAGPLAAALSALAGAGIGAVAGGVAGGLIGALVDMGVPEEHAGYYAEGVRRGGTLVTLQAEDTMSDRAVEIMNRFNPVDVQERVSSWKQQGWTAFDTAAAPYTPEEMDRERTYYSAAAVNDYDTYADRFRQHYQTTMAAAGYPYDYYDPAYRYGYDLARGDRYRGRNWDDFEMYAREDWERDHPGTWDEFKATIRHAWEEVKDAVS
jgi:hypothetical protein